MTLTHGAGVTWPGTKRRHVFPPVVGKTTNPIEEFKQRRLRGARSKRLRLRWSDANGLFGFRHAIELIGEGTALASAIRGVRR